MLGRWEYFQKLRELHDADENSEAWFTPVEIFAPWYSYALAKCIIEQYAVLRSQKGASKLKIYEIGAGTGTNALHILDYIRLRFPHIYNTMEYVTLEISPTLAESQRERLSRSHRTVHRGHCVDATVLGLPEFSSAQSPPPPSERAVEKVVEDEEPCFVLALEVLDNLPHDKVIRAGGPFAREECFVDPSAAPDAWQEVWVRPEPSHATAASEVVTWHEEARPLRDPSIRAAVEAFVCRPERREREGGRRGRRERGEDDPSVPPPFVRGFVRRSMWSFAHRMRSAQQSLQQLFYSPEERSTDDPDSFVVTRSSREGGQGDDLEIRPLERQQVDFGDDPRPLGQRALPPNRLWKALWEDPQHSIFVPTGALRMLEALRRRFPHHRLIAADFNALPPPDLGGSARSRLHRHPGFAFSEVALAGNAPLVAERPPGATQPLDHASYLAPKPMGAADIFFATDFAALAETWVEGTGRSAQVLPTGEFLDRFGDVDQLRTISGFNPAIDTYLNTRILLGS